MMVESWCVQLKVQGDEEHGDGRKRHGNRCHPRLQGGHASEPKDAFVCVVKYEGV